MASKILALSALENYLLKIHGRNNWEFYENPNLAIPLSAIEEYEAVDITPENVSETVFLRSEWETLAKLPESQAVLFTIRSRTFYLPDLKKKSPRAITKLIAALEKGQASGEEYAEWFEYLLNYLKTR